MGVLFGKSPIASDFSVGNTITTAAGMDNQLFVSTYMLQLPDKGVLEKSL